MRLIHTSVKLHFHKRVPQCLPDHFYFVHPQFPDVDGSRDLHREHQQQLGIAGHDTWMSIFLGKKNF